MVHFMNSILPPALYISSFMKMTRVPLGSTDWPKNLSFTPSFILYRMGEGMGGFLRGTSPASFILSIQIFKSLLL